MGRNTKTIGIFVFILLAVFFVEGCSNVTMDLQEVFTGEERVDRDYTIERIKLGILTNTQICPGNLSAGVYFIESTLPHEISRENYIASTVES